MDYVFNLALGRAANDAAAFGYPCYEGSVKDGQFVGTRVGVARSMEDAEAWVAGDEPANPLIVLRTLRA